MPTPINDNNAKTKGYKLSKNTDLVASIMQTLSRALTDRESQLRIDNWKTSPTDIWEMGERMFEEGNRHLPGTWTNTVCPKELHLSEAPTYNIYKRLVEVMIAAILQSTPDVEFQLTEDTVKDTPEEQEMDGTLDGVEAQLLQMGISMPVEPELPDAMEATRNVVERLNREWEKFAEKSKMMGEYDSTIKNACNFGPGWMSLNAGDENDMYGRATHPQLIIFDPSAERTYEIKWIAKVFAVPWSGSPGDQKPEQSTVYDAAHWPSNILKKPAEQEMRIELWVKKGAAFAGYRWEEHGIHAVIAGSNTVVSEEEWNHKRFPLTQFILLPSDTIWGQSMSMMLYEAQVRADKILAFLLSRTARTAGEKYHVMKDTAETIVSSRGTALTEMGSKNLTKPGVQIVYESAKIEMMPPPPVPQDLYQLWKNAIADIEKLAGLSAAYQGIPPKSVTAGKAIEELAEQSSRRVNRMATHMAEGIREFAYTWAEYELERTGEELPKGMEVKVTLSIQEEETRRDQFEKIMQVAENWETIPPELKEIVIDSIPGLTPANRKMLMDIIAQQMQGAQMGEQGAAPGATPPAQSPEVGGVLPPQMPPMLPEAMPVMSEPPGGMMPPGMAGQFPGGI